MAKNKLIWHTEKRVVKDLVPYRENPRQIGEKQLDDLKKSIKRSGYAEIIVIDTDGTIAAGNQRHRALMEMGMCDKEIDVRVPDRKLTKDEFERYLIASNSLGGDWDFEKLKSFEIETLLDIGFDEETLSHIWDNALEIENDDWDDETEIKKIKEPTVKPGEIWALGQHRLICANSQDPKAIQKLVGNKKIDVVDFDPIFNINLSYSAGIGGTKNYGGKVSDKKSETEYRAFLKSLIENSAAVAKDDAHFFVWCDQNYIGTVQSLYDELGIQRKRVCSWIKNNQNPTPKVAFNKATESCVYGVRGCPFIAPHLLNLNEIANKEVGSGSRTIDDIIDLFEIWLAKRIPSSTQEHPTQKPPSLYEKALKRCSRPGDLVLDVCSGSGSLMIACEQLKRQAFLSEIDPVFATLQLKRYEKFTSQKARRIN